MLLITVIMLNWYINWSETKLIFIHRLQIFDSKIYILSIRSISSMKSISPKSITICYIAI